MGGHSFTVSGEGLVAKQLLAEYWRSRAPSVHESYIDLLLLDGEQSNQLVLHTLAELQLDGRSRLVKMDSPQ